MLYEQIAQNKRKTLVVMFAFLGFVLLVGAALGYVFYDSVIAGVLMALFLGIGYMAFMIGQATEVVMSMNHAQEITDVQQAPELWHIIEDMALVAKVPMPRVFIIDDASPNAFATGQKPEKAAVAVTTGLLARLNREELEGVIAHEVSHIRNYDIRLQSTALALVAVVSLLSNMAMNAFWWGGGRRHDDEEETNPIVTVLMILGSLFVIVLGPLVATMMQLALSRNREYLADASAVELTRNPQGLISALRKISQSEPMEHVDKSNAALYIDNPFKEEASDLFATHPPIEARIKRLESM